LNKWWFVIYSISDIFKITISLSTLVLQKITENTVECMSLMNVVNTALCLKNYRNRMKYIFLPTGL